jgi:hypothetical protein
MEIKKGGQTLMGFPALIDGGDAVTIEVFDEPEVAAAKHRAGLRRLFALQIKDALKYLEKNIPDLQKMAVAYACRWARRKSCVPRSSTWRWTAPFLLDPLPTDEAAFKRRVEEGRGRLTLIANEVARLAGTILTEYAAAARKIKDTKNAPEATADVRPAAAAPDAQALHCPGPLGATGALSRATSRPSPCAWTSTAPTPPATPPSWPSCARKSSATGAWWPSARARWTPACKSCAGCWKSCA